jgi:transposase
MAFTGLVPSERSSGDSVWRGHTTRTGSKHLRFQLVESAWSYHHRPLIAGAMLIEAHDEWQVAERRYLSEGSMAKLAPTGDDDRRPKEVKRATAELVAS